MCSSIAQAPVLLLPLLTVTLTELLSDHSLFCKVRYIRQCCGLNERKRACA